MKIFIQMHFVVVHQHEHFSKMMGFLEKVFTGWFRKQRIHLNGQLV